MIAVAEAWSKLFMTSKRQGTDEEFTTTSITGNMDHPLMQAIYSAHDGRLPDDYKFEMCRMAVDAIAEASDDDDIDELRDSATEAPVYTAELTKWLASSNDRPGYVDDAMKEFGIEKAELLTMLAWGYTLEAQEVFNVMAEAIEAEAENSEDDDASAEDTQPEGPADAG